MREMLLIALAWTLVAADGGGHAHGHVNAQAERSGPHGDQAVRDAIDKLDKQFLYLLSTIAGLIDPALSSITSSCEQSSFQTQTYGWALIGGGSLDTLADYIGNGRTPLDVITMPDVIYSYGYNLGYGVGFGSPFLLPTYLGSCSIDCSSTDFTGLAQRYGITNGLAGQYIGESKICNFGLDAKQALGCLLQQKGDNKEAAQVDYLIDDLVEAGVQRIKLQKKLGYV